MDREQELSNLINELMDGIENGDWDDPQKIPEKYTWAHLEALFYGGADSTEEGRQVFQSLHTIAMHACQQRLKRKSNGGATIRIVFQSYSAAQWPAEFVYRKFEQLPNCEVGVFISPLYDRSVEARRASYIETREWFLNTGHKVWEGYDAATDQPISFEDAGAFPDIIYQLSTWYNAFAPSQQITSLPISIPIGYIDYTLNIQDNIEGDYLIKALYNKDISNLCWRVYCDFPFNLKGFQEHQILKGDNVRCYGYTKMDYFYTHNGVDETIIDQLWRIPRTNDASIIKKVIYAPHFSIFDEGHCLFSTFHHNLWFFIYLAEKYSERISFIFKPHPSLRESAVTRGLFDSYESYDGYVERWNRLPNSKVTNEGSYLEIFESSDALITDSISFIGEYMYTGKPMLQLWRPEQRLTRLGEQVIDVNYSVDGRDYSAIEDFLQDVVLNENDSKYEKRHQLFQEEFDYVKINGATASEMIYQDFVNLAF